MHVFPRLLGRGALFHVARTTARHLVRVARLSSNARPARSSVRCGRELAGGAVRRLGRRSYYVQPCRSGLAVHGHVNRFKTLNAQFVEHKDGREGGENAWATAPHGEVEELLDG